MRRTLGCDRAQADQYHYRMACTNFGSGPRLKRVYLADTIPLSLRMRQCLLDTAMAASPQCPVTATTKRLASTRVELQSQTRCMWAGSSVDGISIAVYIYYESTQTRHRVYVGSARSKCSLMSPPFHVVFL